MITAATALALNLDVEVANNVANNALNNNFAHFAVMAAIAAFDAYEQDLVANRDAIIDFVVEKTGMSREAAAATFDAMMQTGRVASMLADLIPGRKKAINGLVKGGRALVKKGDEKATAAPANPAQVKGQAGGHPNGQQGAQPAEAAANPLAKHGKVPVRNKSDQEFVQDIANRADKLTPAIGPKAGQDKHKYARKLGERYQRMTGDRQDLVFEQRHKAGEIWEHGDGLKDSVIPDVYNKKTGQAFDYKFGNAKLGKDQQARLQQQLPQPLKKPSSVTEIKPQNGGGQ